jgi:hypothetical protein
MKGNRQGLAAYKAEQLSLPISVGELEALVRRIVAEVMDQQGGQASPQQVQACFYYVGCR